MPLLNNNTNGSGEPKLMKVWSTQQAARDSNECFNVKSKSKCHIYVDIAHKWLLNKPDTFVDIKVRNSNISPILFKQHK